MKIFFKVILLIIISIAIYLLLPLKSDKLIYIPSKTDKHFNQAIKMQMTPLNSLDIAILKFYNIKEGWVRVSNKTNRYKLYKELLKNKRESTRKIIMYGGDTIFNFSKTVAKQTELNRDKLINVYKELSPFHEAGILAKKYNIPYKATEHSIISYMVYKTLSYYKDLAKKEGVEINSQEFKDKLIIASIIEKETQDYNEMPLISAVIQNRLKKGIKLQMDATLNYGKYSHRVVTPAVIKNDLSKYNTYRHKGLPPEPIGSVSKVSLLSAFMPAEVDYLYFVKKPKGGHTFSSTYKKHQAKVKTYKENLEILREKKRKLDKLIHKKIYIRFPMIYPKIHIPKQYTTYKSKR